MNAAAQFTRNLEMMRDRGNWPMWPVLPVKRPSTTGYGFPDCGLMVAWEGNLTTVFHASMFELKSGAFKEVFGSLPHTRYTDYEAILDAGWVVD